MKERSKAMKKKKILMIIPAYNEEKNILSVYHTIQKYNKEHNVNYEVLVINDGSTDQTESILKEHQIPYITLVHNLGIGGAVQTGYKYAYEHQYDIAIQFDGDGQHDVAFVKDIIKPIVEEKADFVIGSRFIDKKVSKFQSTKARQLGIRMISATMHLVTGEKIYDTTSGFRAANASIIKEYTGGGNLNSYLNDMRLEYSIYLLKNHPEMSIQEIGEASALPSSTTFYRLFKEKYDISPKVFREQLK